MGDKEIGTHDRRRAKNKGRFPAKDLFVHLADAVGAPAGPESSAFSLTL